MNGFARILSYAEEYKSKIYLAVILIFFSVIAGIIPYIITYDIIINFVESNTITPYYLLLISGVITLFLWLRSHLLAKGLEASHDAAYDILMGIRIKFAEKLMKLPLGDINEKGTGSFKKKFVDDIENLELFLAHMLPEGIPSLITAITVYVILFVLDWRLALLSIASISIGVVASTMMMKAGLKKMGKYYSSAQKMNSTIVEYIAGMEVIKIFNRTTSSYENYTSAVEDYKKYTLDWLKDSWVYMAIYGSVMPCTVLFLLPVGIVFYVNGSLTLPTFLFALLLSMSLSSPLIRLVDFLPMFPMITYKVEQIEESFAGQELKIQDKGIRPENHDVKFENVTFAYDEKDVINDVSFCAKENSVTAIVGESGSGKSTLAKLLVHFWDVKEGKITIGGVNIKDMSFEKLMGLISYVSQDTFLFNISVMENIRIGRPGASDEEVMAAAKLAQCHDFIMNMERGYDTNAGDAGDKLSGGEKQRITIARAILKNTPIIILDEATAFTDPENEDKLQEALNKLIVGKTVLVIAHRLSTIVGADNIVLMDEGNLIMQGTHEELLKKSDMYQSLWNSHMQTINWDINVKEAQHA